MNGQQPNRSNPKKDNTSEMSYSDIEYLCKNVKAKKGIPWIISLRDGKMPDKFIGKQTEAIPPKFWEDDIEKWNKRVSKSNQFRIKEMEGYKTSFSFEPKNFSSKHGLYSTIDSILLRGDISPVYLAELQYEHIIISKKSGHPTNDQLNFPYLLRNYVTDGDKKSETTKSISVHKRKLINTLDNYGIYRPKVSL